MFEDNEKEFNPSESEEFLKIINEVLDLPEENEQETIAVEPDDSVKGEIQDSELDAYDAAIAQSVASLFDEIGASEDSQDSLPEVQTDVFSEEPDSTDSDFPQESLSGEEEIIDDINAALAQQVNEISAAATVPVKSKKWLLTLIPIAGIAFLFTKFRQGMPKWLMGIRIAVFSVFALLVLGTVASGGKLIFDIAGIYSRFRMSGSATTPTPALQPTGVAAVNPDNMNQLEKDPEDVDSPVIIQPNPPRTEDHIINILLLGEEKIGSEYSRGRTDLIMIATLDTEQRTIKLTSIMRDILVAIPGHTDNRINSVYSTGGIELLKEVIEINFEIAPDGYMLVDFDSFEKIINNLDGVTIELSAEEAEYLNTTNYISNPIYRNVVPGINKMNGNQALGYCRVRHVPTIDNVHADFGRTSRQRVLLNAIFEKMKTKNLFQLAIFADSCLPLIETDLSASQISDYMEKAVECRVTSFVQMRLPIDGTFKDATYNGITDLIQINFPENIKALHEFIFGDYQAE